MVVDLTLSPCFSDPYVRIDLNTIIGDETVDSVLTKTKKKVLQELYFNVAGWIFFYEEFCFAVNVKFCNMGKMLVFIKTYEILCPFILRVRYSYNFCFINA